MYEAFLRRTLVRSDFTAAFFAAKIYNTQKLFIPGR